MSVKKKIKDLTLEEFDSFCDSQPSDCKGCPLNHIEFGTESCGCDLLSYIARRDALKKRYEKYPLDQEIEVDVDE